MRLYCYLVATSFLKLNTTKKTAVTQKGVGLVRARRLCAIASRLDICANICRIKSPINLPFGESSIPPGATRHKTGRRRDFRKRQDDERGSQTVEKLLAATRQRAKLLTMTTPVPHPRDPLHGITLEHILNQLVHRHGWGEMGRRIPVRCFQFNPRSSPASLSCARHRGRGRRWKTGSSGNSIKPWPTPKASPPTADQV